MPTLRIRPLEHSDIEHVGRYWTTASSEDLDRMGVDPARIPPPEKLRAPLEEWLVTPENRWTWFPTVWLVDDEPVGYSTVKDLKIGETGCQHLHVWAASMRGKGYGAPLFCLTAVSAYERFRLRSILCEPKSDNPFPNRMLAKIGFPFLGKRIGASSDLSAVVELATYRIERALAEKFLARYRRTEGGGVLV